MVVLVPFARLDYMSEKFSASVPPWTSGTPFSHNISEHFYTHTMRDHSEQNIEDANHKLRSADILIRYGQVTYVLVPGSRRAMSSYGGEGIKEVETIFCFDALTLLGCACYL